MTAGTAVAGYAAKSAGAKVTNAYNASAYQNDLAYRDALVKQQNEDAARQIEYVERAAKGINDNLRTQYATLGQRIIEERISAAIRTQDAVRQGQKERSTAEVIMGERGIEGNSVDNVLNDVDAQVGRAKDMVRMNTEASDRQLSLTGQGLRAEADTALNAIPMKTFNPIAPVQARQNVAGPSGAMLAFQLGGAALGGVSDYSKYSGNSLREITSGLRSKLKIG